MKKLVIFVFSTCLLACLTAFNTAEAKLKAAPKATVYYGLHVDRTLPVTYQLQCKVQSIPYNSGVGHHYQISNCNDTVPGKILAKNVGKKYLVTYTVSFGVDIPLTFFKPDKSCTLDKGYRPPNVYDKYVHEISFGETIESLQEKQTYAYKITLKQDDNNNVRMHCEKQF